ncbi:hypothetical protein BJY00DRAFT_203042 [Aspergillus carlsbadensis]|nr:hypothetical protein BJY00DRAFT_203042 [Aspergillus carlsbadensis]
MPRSFHRRLRQQGSQPGSDDRNNAGRRGTLLLNDNTGLQCGFASTMGSLPPELFFQALADLSFCESAQYLPVNRRWFHYLSPIIWKHAADHRILRIQPHRRQIYAPLIQQLELTSQHNGDTKTWDLSTCPN